MSTYNCILVPLDNSDLSDRVLDTALGTAAWSGATVVLLRVQPDSLQLTGSAAENDLDVVEQDVEGLLLRAAERQGLLPMPPRDKVRAEVRTGNVVEAILSAIDDLQVDLVIMGMHGREGLIEQLTGSTTERVAARAPASVFVVRPQGYPYLTD